MPIYEYRCESCGHEMEALQKISDAPLTQCPTCDKATLVKLVSAAGFRLKGGGWYETDFKSSNRRNVAGQDKASGDGKGGKKAAADAAAGKTPSGGSAPGSKGS
ncbi:MAG: zinc ribbon domain-containing protein [Pseudomonadota bacterium]|nr:MAG: zinc ribbon domain-containing protein [Pseudomonadota bacterium]